jgi:Cu+-exporting ATPase
MSIISGIMSSVLPRVKLATPGKVELPPEDNELLTAADVEVNGSGKCELRIEGMTCGACVEVSFYHADAL